MHLAVTYLAANSDPLNITGLNGILSDVLGLLVTAAAIRAVFHAFRGGAAAVVTIVVIVAIGAMVYGIEAGNLIGALGRVMDHAALKL